MDLKKVLKSFWLSVLSFFLVAGVLYAATTIGTDIVTTGTLSVTGISTLTGAVTMSSTLGVTGLSTLGFASTTGISSTGDITVGGYASTSAATGNIATKGTLTVTGLSTLGFASSTGISSTGDITVGGYASTSAATGNIATRGTLTVGSAGSAITDLLFGTCTVTLGSMNASSTQSANCTATGVTAGAKVFVTPYITNPQVLFTSASSTATSVIQVSVYFTGANAGTLNPDDNTWSWMAIR